MFQCHLMHGKMMTMSKIITKHTRYSVILRFRSQFCRRTLDASLRKTKTVVSRASALSVSSFKFPPRSVAFSIVTAMAFFTDSTCDETLWT